LENFVSIISILEGVAVVGTLLFLATQVRQNTINSKVATRTAAHEEGMQLTQIPLQNETVRRLLAGNLAYADATPEEKVEINSYNTAFFYSMENWHYMLEQGLFGPDDWHSFTAPLLRNHPKQIENQTMFWQNNRAYFGPSYRSAIDGIFAGLTANEN
jgi:hypothetical protein